MKNFNIGIYLLFLLILNYAPARSQNTGGWFGIEMKYDLPKGFSAELEGEMRTDFTYGFVVDQFFPQAGLSYKINKHFDVSGAYRFIQKRENNGYYYNRNKYMFNLMTDFTVERFILKNRIRYQTQVKQYIDDELDAVPDKYIRDKFEIAYNIKNTPVEPYVSIEVFYPLNQFEINTINELRICGGVDVPVAKKQSVNISLMYNKERFTRINESYIVCLGYSFSVN